MFRPKITYKFVKSILDFFVAIVLIIILLIPMVILWLLASYSTQRNGLFQQIRIGQYGKPFTIYKFRSMRTDSNNSVTTSKTHDITPFGHFLIRSKLDELPQLFNIINGTMSFVGPRPDVSGYADKLEGSDKIILNVKPGITGPAQIKYKNESALLEKQANPQAYNDTVLWKDKVAINKKYVNQQSFMVDLRILINTIF